MLSPITALVPIKGISERVPGKNTRIFCGRPLLHWVLNTLQQCIIIGNVVVNTDSEKIAKLCLDYSKVIIHKRPEELCGNNVSVNSIIEYDIGLTQSEYYIQTHVTNPMLTEKTIRSAVATYFTNLDRGYDSLFSVLVHQSRFFNENYVAINHDPSVLLNTQDLAPIYEENSCIYIFSRSSFKANGNRRIGLFPFFFPISQLESIDIDTEEDFNIAQIAHAVIYGKY